MDKCNFAETDAEWLGFYFSPTNIKLLNHKVQGFTNQLQQKVLRELFSLLEAVNQMKRIFPNLA